MLHRNGPRPATDVDRPRRRRWPAVTVLLVAVTLALPVPWLHVVSDDPPGHAWRLNGRLHVNGETLDPPGRWSWLTVGRPQTVVEALLGTVSRPAGRTSDLRAGPVANRPTVSEPAAAAVGLRAAGHELDLGLLVEARDPVVAGIPGHVQITSLGGIELTDRAAFDRAVAATAPDRPMLPIPTVRTSREPGYTHPAVQPRTFTLPDGRQFPIADAGLPYRTVTTLDLAPAGLSAGISFLPDWVPDRWVRSLSTGRSHGAMVALVTYAHASGYDLAQGRHIAGTGGVRGDGTLVRIGGLDAKARAAHRAGADVLIFPGAQADELDPADFPGMDLVAADTLDDAIVWLARPVI